MTSYKSIVPCWSRKRLSTGIQFSGDSLFYNPDNKILLARYSHHGFLFVLLHQQSQRIKLGNTNFLEHDTIDIRTFNLVCYSHVPTNKRQTLCDEWFQIYTSTPAVIFLSCLYICNLNKRKNENILNYPLFHEFRLSLHWHACNGQSRFYQSGSIQYTAIWSKYNRILFLFSSEF